MNGYFSATGLPPCQSACLRALVLVLIAMVPDCVLRAVSVACGSVQRVCHRKDHCGRMQRHYEHAMQLRTTKQHLKLAMLY